MVQSIAQNYSVLSNSRSYTTAENTKNTSAKSFSEVLDSVKEDSQPQTILSDEKTEKEDSTDLKAQLEKAMVGFSVCAKCGSMFRGHNITTCTKCGSDIDQTKQTNDSFLSNQTTQTVPPETSK